MRGVLAHQIEIVPTDRLTLHPKNPRQGDVGGIYESISENGFYGTLVVQRSTGYVLVGNHRLIAAREAGLEEVPVFYVDVDDERALRILLVDNRTNDRASYNEAELTDLLKALSEDSREGLSGTGYDGEDLDRLLADLERDTDKGFLDDIADSSATDYKEAKKEEGAEASSAPSDATEATLEETEDGRGYFTLSFTIARDDREIAMRALRLAKKRHNTGNSIMAFMGMCEEYLGEASGRKG